MTKTIGSILASLVVLQGALPSLGLEAPFVNILAVVVAMAVAGLTFYLGKSPVETTFAP